MSTPTRGNRKGRGRWPTLFVAVPPPLMGKVLEIAKADGLATSAWVRELIKSAILQRAGTIPPPPVTMPTPAASVPPPDADLAYRVWVSVGGFLEGAGAAMPYKSLLSRLKALNPAFDYAPILLKSDTPAHINREQRADGVWFSLAA